MFSLFSKMYSDILKDQIILKDITNLYKEMTGVVSDPSKNFDVFFKWLTHKNPERVSYVLNNNIATIIIDEKTWEFDISESYYYVMDIMGYLLAPDRKLYKCKYAKPLYNNQCNCNGGCKCHEDVNKATGTKEKDATKEKKSYTEKFKKELEDSWNQLEDAIKDLTQNEKVKKALVHYDDAAHFINELYKTAQKVCSECSYGFYIQNNKKHVCFTIGKKMWSFDVSDILDYSKDICAYIKTLIKEEIDTKVDVKPENEQEASYANKENYQEAPKSETEDTKADKPKWKEVLRNKLLTKVASEEDFKKKFLAWVENELENERYKMTITKQQTGKITVKSLVNIAFDNSYNLRKEDTDIVKNIQISNLLVEKLGCQNANVDLIMIDGNYALQITLVLSNDIVLF